MACHALGHTQGRASTLAPPDAYLGERLVAALPSLGATPKGPILIRDLRLGHRGTPNTRDDTRFMIAMIHNAAWYKRPCRFDLDKNCAHVFDGCVIENGIPLVDEPSDHIDRNEPYEYAGSN